MNLLYSMSFVLKYIHVQHGYTKNKGRALAQADARTAYIPGWSMWDFLVEKLVYGKGAASVV